MVVEYKIHPSIGVARIGNSTDFYLSPIEIGGLPLECEEYGDERFDEHGNPVFVKKFKDSEKKVRRQAAKFRIFKHDTENISSPVEVDLSNDENIKKVTWRVHLANKKSAWHHFDFFLGDLLIGKDNTYPKHEDPKSNYRNSDVEGDDRKKLIIDFGYRELTSPSNEKIFSISDTGVPNGYARNAPYHQQNGKGVKIGATVTELGSMKTDSKMNLTVVGGKGIAGGNEPYSDFAGGNEWYDDISDGPVLCELTLADGSVVTLDAWVLVGPTKFAPELVNITTLYDTLFDVAVIHQKKIPELYDGEKWNSNFCVNYDRDIAPIVERIGHYRWVANIPSMTNFSNPSFDLRDNSEKNRKNREAYFSYFRKPAKEENGYGGENNVLSSSYKNSDKEGFYDEFVTGIPLMPANSGSNSAGDQIMDRFVTLSKTQYFFLEQWSKGKFTTEPANDFLDLTPLDHADLGNSVGAPLCPGIEVTWSVRNPAIYSTPFRIRHKTKDLKYYLENGLDPNHEETASLDNPDPPPGCEPGDLTKRMAIPWMSDLFECNVQHVNFTRVDRNRSGHTGLEEPPTYYAYWWPPQAPWDVILGVTEPDTLEPEKRKASIIKEIKDAGVSVGQQVNYIRGINSHMQMVANWWHLGFILNQNEDENRKQYPYFVEKERNHEKFEAVAMSVGHKVNIVDPGQTRFVTGFFAKDDQGQY